MTAGTTVVLFTRDLRVDDHPALAAACREARRLVPLFVVDPRVSGPFASANRGAFLADALADLRNSLRQRGSDLVVRRGDVVEETLRLAREAGAIAVVASADVSRFAQRREELLRRACAGERLDFRTFPGVTVVPPGELTPAGGDHYRVFTPFWRAWQAVGWRPVEGAPTRVPPLPRLPVGRLPARTELAGRELSPHLPDGGESAGRRVLDAADLNARSGRLDLDDLAGDHTSRLSPYLHFGCVSPLVVAHRLAGSAPAQVRQLAWRDFHHQVTAAFPDIARRDYRNRGAAWRDDPDALGAWQEGRTGIPVVDAGMRQLLAEGWMHNRARLITASFLTKHLAVDWRLGAAHFFRWLVDGDVASNAGNWQWVAGTGNNTRPNRILNPLRQAKRFDPRGDYVRRYVHELAGIGGPAVHEPWNLPEPARSRLRYPAPLLLR
ncbi:MAG TPA: deoxyribodipyrimidine photo-lyase [Jiangellaceae bacterium]|nr:deoxyribodipyrimidine photo-lyase [Jiangellaceae bacterium]